MTEDTTVTKPVTSTDGKGDTTTEADSGKTTETVVFDPTKISDDDFAKVFTDERLWKHERFKTLNEKAKQAEKLKETIKTQEQKKLEENQEWQKLAETRAQELEQVQTKYQSEKISNALRIEAGKQGAVDVDTVLALVNKDSIEITDTGITGVAEAVKSLLETKPFLAGNSTTTLGKGSNPADAENTSPKKFKASQLKDVKFYRENEKDIIKAMGLGLIEDDLAE